MEHNRAGTFRKEGRVTRWCKCGANWTGTEKQTASDRHEHILTAWYRELVIQEATLFDSLEGGAA